MKNHYDKLFLLVALLLMAASGAYFFSSNSSLDLFKRNNNSLVSVGAQGELWENKEVKVNVSKSMAWRYPDFQDVNGDWLFQVFTPPRIWVDADGNFITRAPKIERIITEEEMQEAPCDLYLAEVTNGLYYISLVGYMGAKNDPIFQLKDIRDPSRPIEFNAKKGVDLSYKDPNDLTGKTMIDLGLKIINFEKNTVKYEDNTIKDVMIIQIEDKKLAKLVELRLNEDTILPEQRKMKLRSKIDPSKEWLVSGIGEEVVYNDSTYLVKEISFENERIKLSQIPDTSKYLSSSVVLTPEEASVATRSSFGDDESSSLGDSFDSSGDSLGDSLGSDEDSSL